MHPIRKVLWWRERSPGAPRVKYGAETRNPPNLLRMDLLAALLLMIRPYFKNDILAAKRRRQKWAETEKKRRADVNISAGGLLFFSTLRACADLNRVLCGLLFHFFPVCLLFEEGNCVFSYLPVARSGYYCVPLWVLREFWWIWIVDSKFKIVLCDKLIRRIQIWTHFYDKISSF